MNVKGETLMLFNSEGSNFVFADGAIGTLLQKNGLKPGERPDIMNITAPDVVENVQRMYAEAGSSLIYTNTFGANAQTLKGTGYSPKEIISAAVAITKRAGYGQALTALDIGPTGDMIEPLGAMSFDRAYELFREQAEAGESAGADLAAIETMSDLMELKAAILAVKENTKLPVLATMTFDKNGRTFTGCLPESFAVMAERLGVCAVGINCSLEPAEMFPTAGRIAKMTALPLVVKPNAGLPDSGTGQYGISPAGFAAQMAEYAGIGARIIGGCCGTTPEYIRELIKAFAEITPVKQVREPGAFICTPMHIARVDGLAPKREDGIETCEAALTYVSRQNDSGAEIVETYLPDGLTPDNAARFIGDVQEITAKPIVVVSSGLTALNSALRAVCGIAAVFNPNGKTERLLELAAGYGAEVL